MKNFLMTVGATGLVLGLSSLAGAANKTMTGEISDSMCGASHAAMIAQHKDTKMTDRDCTQACIKGGAKYVFVADGKVYSISNQDMGDLAKYAGDKVSLRGDVNGDSVTVSKISASK